MTAILQFDGLDALTLPGGPLHLAIGMFDGVHRGHRTVIEPAVHAANAGGGVAAVMTFWPHPSVLFRPENPTRLIQDPISKCRVLTGLGVQVLITEAFTQELAGIEAENFLPWLKRQLPQLTAVYVGENFRFGRGRRGDGLMLKASGGKSGLAVSCAPRFEYRGELVSSTRIRAHLVTGEIEIANSLLGYDYFSHGVVTPGKQLGRTIGFPTLNLPWRPDLQPRLGVYAVNVSSWSEPSKGHAGVANYGLRPTVEQATEPRLEVHLLDDCPFDAGDRLVVEWRSFVRPEMKFANLSELRAQIGRDRTRAAQFFSR